ncbi:hypothetical protein [Candidatus Pantoea carbekii]|nr:hypothetical protein [Candidatus Pantoea carbekii]
MKCKGELEQHFSDINQGGARIIIGTKMIAKDYFFKMLLSINARY